LKYTYGTPENLRFAQAGRDALFCFGTRFAAPGGSAYYLGRNGTPLLGRPRETWITARMAHVYCLGYFLGFPGANELAADALRGLSGELHDAEHGGWYAGLRPDGTILPGKQCYAHAFVILAASSGCLAGIPGSEALLQDALQVYDRYFWDDEAGLSRDLYDTAFTVCDPYRGLNANMHTVEAFLAVADAAGLEEYRCRAGRIIRRVLVWAEETNWRLPEHYSENWLPQPECNRDRPDDPFKPYGATPGHGIEWARLITQWACSAFGSSSAGAQPYLAAAEALYCRAVEDAWSADGSPGICYTTGWDGKPVVHDRMHWALAEAINTSAVLYRVTGKARYAEDYAAFQSYLDEFVLDRTDGSWFHQLDQNNRLLETVWPGKPDLYHAVQAALIPYCEPSVSVAAAVKKKLYMR